MQRFASVVHRIHYATAVGSGDIYVAGVPATVSAKSDWSGLRRRRSLMLGAGAVVLLATAGLCASYVGRHEWFLRYGAAQTIAAFGAIGSVVLVLLAGAALLAARARNIALVATAALVTAGNLAGAAWVARTRVPSGATARAALARGEPQRPATGDGVIIRGSRRARDYRRTMAPGRARSVAGASGTRPGATMRRDARRFLC